MDKIKRKSAFEQWAEPISNELFAEQVQLHCLDHYTKKLHMASFMNLLLYAQLHETESLRAVSDSVFSEELQEATNLDSIGFSQLGRRLRQVRTVLKVLDSNGNQLNLITNRFDLSADEIADLYMSR